jgi:hypothetical protein
MGRLRNGNTVHRAIGFDRSIRLIKKDTLLNIFTSSALTPRLHHLNSTCDATPISQKLMARNKVSMLTNEEA